MASGAWERRNARARLLGYQNYYDYRVHNSGRAAPSVPVTSEMRAANRGHRSLADLKRLLGRLGPEGGKAGPQVLPLGLDRGPDGRWRSVDVLVMMPDGTERRFVLRGRQASRANLRRLRDSLDAGGIRFQAAPSIDVFAGAEAAAA